MKHIFYILLGSPLFSSLVNAFTGGNIGTTSYTFSPEEVFPTPRDRITTDDGVDNVVSYLVGFIPFLTVLIAIFATLMVIFWGFFMVMGWASTAETEKGKNIIKNALMGVVIGLLAYVIIITLWNILDI